MTLSFSFPLSSFDFNCLHLLNTLTFPFYFCPLTLVDFGFMDLLFMIRSRCDIFTIVENETVVVEIVGDDEYICDMNMNLATSLSNVESIH